MLPISINWNSIKKLPLLRKLKVIRKALFVALLTWVVMLVIAKFFRPADIWLEWNELFFYTRFFKNAIGHENHAGHPQHAIDQLVVVDSEDPTENLSRREYAEFIELLTADGAACIGMDTRFVENREVFEDREWDSEGQAALVRAFKNNARIILPFRIARVIQEESRDDYRIAKTLIEQRFALPPNVAASVSNAQMFRQWTEGGDGGFHIEHPIRPLLEGIDYLGHINFEPDRHHLFPLILGFDNSFYKSFAFEIARAYRDSRGEPLALLDIPRHKHGRMLVNYIPWKIFPKMPMGEARALLQNNAGSFRGKIVLIVNSSAERPIVRTPLDSGEYPLWAIHASLICQILDGENITAARYGNIIFATALIVLGLLWLLFFSERLSMRWRRMRWVLLFCNAVLVLSAFFLLQADYWLGVVLPMLICSMGLVAVRYDLPKIYELPQYQTFAIAVTEAHEGDYPVSITYSPAGEEEGKISFRDFFRKKEFAAALSRLEQNAGSIADLRTMGNELYAALIQQPIENRLQVSQAMTERSHARLRVQLRLDDPEISALPWEYLRSDKLPVEFMALNPGLSLTRYIPFGAPLTLKEFRGPLKILVAISSPIDLQPLNIDEEKEGIVKALDRALANLGFLRQVKIHFIQATTREKLDQAIGSGKYDVLHFIGHSDYDKARKVSALALENDEGKKVPAEAEELGLMLFGSSIRLAVLNSCEGTVAPPHQIFYGMAQRIVRVGVPAVVAMQHKVFDDTAIAFTQAFYYSLLANYSIDAAVYDARQALRKKQGIARQDWGTPVLFMRTGGAEVFESGMSRFK